MLNLTHTLSQRPLLAGALLFAVAAVGSGVGIATVTVLHDRPAAAVAAMPVVKSNVAAPIAGGSLADLVQSVIPSVVQVQVTGIKRNRLPGVIGPDNGAPGDSLRRYFDDQPPADTDTADEVLGSGFVIDSGKDGAIIVTNAHVVADGSRIRVRLSNSREVPAELVGVDTKTDLAVLRVKQAGLLLPAVTFGDSDAVRVGDAIFAVGSPFGLGSTVTSGIVSGRGREIGEGPYDDFLQIDAAINQGNSGGPLFDRNGHVIGVNTAIFSPGEDGGNVGIGFAIPAHMVQSVVRQLVATGHVTRGQIGVAIQPVTPDIADSLGMNEPNGALVAGVSADSPAARAGLQIGDVITRFNGNAIASARDLSRVVAETPVGDARKVEILRGGKPVSLSIAVSNGEKSTPRAVVTSAPASAAPSSAAVLGMVVMRTTPELNARAEQPARATGVIVTRIDPGSESAGRGLEVGDLIVAANNLRVETPAALKAGVDTAARAGRHNVLLEVLRGTDHAFVAVPLG